MVDSIVYADSQSKILNIESKYNHLKISQEVDRLKIKQQSYIIFSVICISCLLLIMIVYLLYRKQAKEKIHRPECSRIKKITKSFLRNLFRFSYCLDYCTQHDVLQRKIFCNVYCSSCGYFTSQFY